MRSVFLFSGALVFLAACGGGGGNAVIQATSVYKSAGSVQCTGGGITMQEMASQLSGAGVAVISSACGTDGMGYPAACGAADGRIGIFEIPELQIQAASAVGFAPLGNLPNASKIACQ